MARRINELPTDLNLTGDEKIPAQESNGNAVSITPQAITDFVEARIDKSPVLTTQANTFAREYTARGAIKKGQGVGLFTDTDGSTKVKASDNTNLSLVRGEVDNFPSNVDGFNFDFGSASEDLEVQPINVPNIDTSITPNSISNSQIRGIQITFEEQPDGTFEWNPEGNIGDGSPSVLTNPNGVILGTLHRAVVSGTTATLYFRSGSGNRIWYRSGFYEDGTLFYPSSADLNNLSGNFSIVFSSVNITTFRNNNLTLGFEMSTSDSSNITSEIYVFGELGELAGFNKQGPSRARESDDGYYELTLDNSADSNIYTWNSTSTDYTPYVFGSFNNNFYKDKFTFSGLSYSLATRTINFSFENRGSTFSATRVYLELRIGDTDLLTQNLSSLSNSESFTLTEEQATALATGNYVLKFRFHAGARNSSIYGDVTKFFEIVENEDSLDPFTINWNIRTLVDGTIFTGTITSSNSYQTTNSFSVYRLGDNKIFISTNLPLCHMADIITSSKEEIDGEMVNRASGQKKVFIKKQFPRRARVMFIFEKEDNVWKLKKTFRPIGCRINKENDDAFYSSYEFDNILKARETDEEVVFALSNFLNKSDLTDSEILSGALNITGSDSRVNSDDNSVMFIKVSKSDNSINYVLNDNDLHTSNMFENWRLHEQNGFNSLLNGRSFANIAQLGVENSNKFKLYVSRRTYLNSLDEVTRSDYSEKFEKWSIANLVSLPTNHISSSSSSIYSATNRGFNDFFFDERINTLYSVRNSYSSVPWFEYIRFNADVTDFLRNYNSSSQLYDSNTAQTGADTSPNFILIENPFEFIANDSRLGVFLTGRLTLSGGRLRANEAYTGRSTSFGINFSSQIKTSNKILLAGIPNNLILASGLYIFCPYNLVHFYDTSDSNMVTIRKIDNEIDGAGFSFNFSPTRSIGIALDDFADGATGNIAFLSGSSLITISGINLVVGADYYLNSVTGELTSLGGRKIGRAISPTEILVNG